MEEKTLADHDINVRSIHQELQLLEEQLHGRNEPQPSPTVTDEDTVSRKAAIKAIRDTYRVSYPIDMISKDDAADVLTELPSVTPTVTADPDTVSRQAVYDTLTEYYHHTTEIQHKALREALERVPPSPSRPHGQWIKAKDLSGEYYYCSNCKEELPRVATESATWDNPYPTEYSIDTTDFCPHCGADMRQDRGAA